MPAPEPAISDARMRAWCAALAALAAALAAYVSLVPFQFVVPDEMPSIVDVLWTNGHLGGMLRGNGLANVVLFVPFGFFAVGAGVGARSRAWPWALGMLVVATASIGTSIAIEALQIFVPGRTPALSDIVAQTVGTGLGAIGWMALGRQARVWAGRFTTGHASVVRFALGIYTAVYALYLVLPLDVTVDLGALAERYRDGRIVLSPHRSPALTWDLLPSLISDLVMAVPVGACMVLVGTAQGARRPARALWLSMGLLVVGELAQVFVQSRTADVVDLSAAAMGAAAGVALGSSLAGHGARPAESSGVRWALGLSLVVTTAFYVLYNWSPFDFSTSPDFVAGRLGRLLVVPFAGYYQNAEFKALSDATTKLALTVPFGVLLQLFVRPARLTRRRSATALLIGAAAVFFALVEFGQVLLPSRYPDNTDVLLAVAGVWAGMRVTRQFQRTGPRAGTPGS